MLYGFGALPELCISDPSIMVKIVHMCGSEEHIEKMIKIGIKLKRLSLNR